MAESGARTPGKASRKVGAAIRETFRIHKPLVPIKSLTFCYWAANMAISSFKQLHMKSLGLSTMHIGIVCAALHAISAFGGPTLGYYADRTGRHKIVLAVALILSVVFIVPLNYIPRYSNEGMLEPLQLHRGNGIWWDSICGEGMEGVGIQDTVQGCQLQRNGSFTEFAACFVECTGYEQITIANICLHHNASETTPCFTSCLADSNTTVCVARSSKTGSFWLSFGPYLGFAVVSGFFRNVCFVLLDALILQKHTRYNQIASENSEHAVSIGWTRAYINLAMITVSPLFGFLLEQFGRYDIAFSGYAVLIALGVVQLCFMNVEKTEHAGGVVKEVKKLLTGDINIRLFVSALGFIGICLGNLESFLNVYLESELHASKFLIGLTNTVSGMAALVFVLLARKLVKRFGHQYILDAAVVVYGVRFLCYSVIKDPYYILFVEAMECVSNSLMWAVVQMYMEEHIDDGCRSTFQGIVYAIQVGLGYALGSLIGGVIIEFYGARVNFQIFGGLAVFVGIVLFTVTRSCHRCITLDEKKTKPDTALDPVEIQEKDSNSALLSETAAEQTPPPVSVVNCSPKKI